MNPRGCDFDNPDFPPLKKKADVRPRDAAGDLLFGDPDGDLLFGDEAGDLLFADNGDDLFSASNVDGQNVIEQNSGASLCKGAFDICCHKKTFAPTTPAPTPPPITPSSESV